METEHFQSFSCVDGTGLEWSPLSPDTNLYGPIKRVKCSILSQRISDLKEAKQQHMFLIPHELHKPYCRISLFDFDTQAE